MLNDLMMLLLLLTDRHIILNAISQFDDDTLWQISMHQNLSDSLCDMVRCEMNLREMNKAYKEVYALREKLLASREEGYLKDHAISSLNARILELELAPRMKDDPGFYEPTPTELGIALNEGKIPAIKAMRVRTGLGLVETKKALEHEMNRCGWKFASVKPNDHPYPSS